MHPQDAAAREISEGDVVMLHNARGALLAVVSVSVNIKPGVVQLPTGAWYDPVDPKAERPLCRHGNPNVLTRDIGTSALAQGCSGQITVIQATRFTGDAGPVQAFSPLIPAATRE